MFVFFSEVIKYYALLKFKYLNNLPIVVILEKLIIAHILDKFSVFYETWRPIIVSQEPATQASWTPFRTFTTCSFKIDF